MTAATAAAVSFFCPACHLLPTASHNPLVAAPAPSTYPAVPAYRPGLPFWALQTGESGIVLRLTTAGTGAQWGEPRLRSLVLLIWDSEGRTEVVYGVGRAVRRPVLLRITRRGAATGPDPGPGGPLSGLGLDHPGAREALYAGPDRQPRPGPFPGSAQAPHPGRLLHGYCRAAGRASTRPRPRAGAVAGRDHRPEVRDRPSVARRPARAGELYR